MGALFHDNGLPSFIGGAPSFSFVDVAEIIAPAPESAERARRRMQAWERKMGSSWFQHNSDLAHAAWQRNKPWWLI